jgi:hypothetical protein
MPQSLDGRAVGNEALAVSLGEVRFQPEVAWQEAPGLGVPMDARATRAISQHEGAPLANRQRGLIIVVPKGYRRLRRTQKQIVPNAEA